MFQLRKMSMPWLITVAAVVVPLPATAQAVDAGQWIDLFDGETLFGWTPLGAVDWTVDDGAIVAEDGAGGWLATSSRFTDFELQMRLRLDGTGTMGVVVRAPLDGHPSENGSGVITLDNEAGASRWHKVEVTAKGPDVSAKIDGEPVEGLAVDRAEGHIGIQYHNYHRLRKPVKVEVAEVKLRPLGLTPLFNGENLEGWNIIPGHQSEFEVVDNAINITDGNGQIETEGVYRDFMLQIEIISNGDNLNSGVFFRGPKGIFWKGYESQVRNQWIRDDRNKPVDYGTGGIYGVQEARKVVPNDKEWFRKTIVCNDNHIAVWVNGYLVSDFVDARPPVDNGDGKNGFVPEAGTVHLQGHDPTTDLSFRNINIQAYPGE